MRDGSTRMQGAWARIRPGVLQVHRGGEKGVWNLTDLGWLDRHETDNRTPLMTSFAPVPA
jgi:hypothetical protein